ncbi:MAG: Xaa-Pro aminopeptidase [Alphaproteobacteria bacterium]|jgi:Xaa-Pro aminopeptidase
MNATIDIAQYQARRSRLLSMVNVNAIVIIPSAQEVTRSNDTEYPFRQNSDFYYLTGFNEPDCFLLLSSKGPSNKGSSNKALSSNSEQTASQSTLLLRPKDDLAEIWHGRRLGITDAPKHLLVDVAYSVDDIDEILPDMLDGHDYLYYSLGDNLQADDLVQCAMAMCKQAPKQSKQAPSSIVDVSHIIHNMRLIKSAEEIAVMQQSADISCKAHKSAMAACKPGVYEYQLEAIILHSFAMQGARYAAYNTIVGGGENGCILHYVENKDALVDGEVVLIDAGSEYQGYAADITRTFPVNGRFSPAQKEIYNLVLSTQLACINQLKPGRTIAEAMQTAICMITQGLLDLGILSGELQSCIDEDAHKAFFMHGLGHYLGLDVHDVGIYKDNGHDKALESGMVMTVEPGIYISKKANVPEKYKGIGVRIEDNIVITTKGNEVLTRHAPKTVEDIEALMATS